MHVIAEKEHRSRQYNGSGMSNIHHTVTTRTVPAGQLCRNINKSNPIPQAPVNTYTGEQTLSTHTAQFERHIAQLERYTVQLERHTAQLERHTAQLERHTA